MKTIITVFAIIIVSKAKSQDMIGSLAVSPLSSKNESQLLLAGGALVNGTISAVNIIQFRKKHETTSLAGFGIVTGAAEIVYANWYPNKDTREAKNLHTAIGFTAITSGIVRLFRKEKKSDATSLDFYYDSVNNNKDLALGLKMKFNF